jgi:integrase
LENDPETGNEMLVWKTERGSKTRHGQDESSGRRAFYPTAQATGNERCPVMYYKMFKSHRPLLMNQPEARFYLAVKHKRNPNDNIWYKRSPLGKNEIGKLLSKAAQNVGLPGRVTNHSVRKTCVSRLLDSDVPVNFVAQLSGHHNLKSLDAYKSASTPNTSERCHLH